MIGRRRPSTAPFRLAGARGRHEEKATGAEGVQRRPERSRRSEKGARRDDGDAQWLHAREAHTPTETEEAKQKKSDAVR